MIGDGYLIFISELNIREIKFSKKKKILDHEKKSHYQNEDKKN